MLRLLQRVEEMVGLVTRVFAQRLYTGDWDRGY